MGCRVSLPLFRRKGSPGKRAYLSTFCVFSVVLPLYPTYEGEKFAHYQELTSLREYILVSQDRIRVEQYRLIKTQWVQTEFHEQGDVILKDSYRLDPFKSPHVVVALPTAPTCPFRRMPRVNV